MVPDEIADLSSEERNRVYKMLGLRVTVRPGGVLEVSGTFGEGLELSKQDPTRAGMRTPSADIDDSRSSETAGVGRGQRATTEARRPMAGSATAS